MAVEFLVITLHIVFSLFYFVRIYSAKSFLRKEQIVLIFFIPVFGPLVATTIEILNITNKQGVKPIDLEPLNLDSEILWNSLKISHENADIVPLEEAILINDFKVRRRSMLETLYSNPLKYLDILNVAKYNEDIETSHYATTTISKAQKDFHLSIQKLEVALEMDPNNQALLDNYIEALENYIKSNLLEGHLLRNLQIVYSKALDKKLELTANDMNTLIKKARNSINLAEYNLAFDASDLLISTWPENENSWIESVRVCVDSKDSLRLEEITLKMKKQKINWTKEGKESVKIWLEGFLNET
jgi:tetratricopeptide (TPR) repeat protein